MTLQDVLDSLINRIADEFKKHKDWLTGDQFAPDVSTRLYTQSTNIVDAINETNTNGAATALEIQQADRDYAAQLRNQLL